MIFGRVPLDGAEGCILAHTKRLGSRVLRKGVMLDSDAIAALRADGASDVIAARLQPGDISEDEAAARLASVLVGPGLSAGRAATGRVNLLATAPGVLRVDAARINALNGLDEALTVAALADYAVVRAREMVATLKVIPFAVPGSVLERAETFGQSAAPPLALDPFRALTVGLVLTRLPGMKPSVLAGTTEATAARVSALTGVLLPPLECPHETAPIACALETLLQQGADLLLVAGASAVVDRQDVGPAGIVAAGGEILHFGMPVDPGNLICLGRIGTRPALVLPGCARSPALNGIDFVLSRLFAGLAVDGAAIAGMGVGGLLKDVGARPLPRARAVRADPPGTRYVAAVVLAAGQSTRVAPHHKLLLPDRTGKPMVARVVDNVLSSAARPVIVVTGHRAGELAGALSGRPVQIALAPQFADGLSASLKTGIAAVPAGAAAALICLGDMPLVTGRMMDRLIEAYDADEGRLIIVPTFRGKWGNPVLWDRRFFAEISGLSGDVGARSLLSRHTEDIAEVEVGSDAVLRDFDTVESLGALAGHLRPDSA